MKTTRGPWLSVIVPVLDEAPRVAAAGQRWRLLERDGHEVIVVDGGSSDGTAAIAREHANLVIDAPAGRASQMNWGAAVATGRILMFLHVDTELPDGAARLVRDALSRGGWGRFDVRLDDPHPAFRVVERMMRVRSRLTGIATGDQTLFVERGLFEEVGGYPDIELMEDVALSRALGARARPACLRARVRTSARRWRRDGIARTVLLMWCLRLAFALGVPPARLAKIYYGAR